MSNVFEICRRNLGPAPRNFGRQLRRELRPQKPGRGLVDPLRLSVDQHNLLLECGAVAPGALVRFDEDPTEPGDGNVIALALWTLDARLETDLSRLLGLSTQLHHQLESDVPDELRPLSKGIEREEKGPLCEPLPPDWGVQGAPFFLSRLLIRRAHLPCRFLPSEVFPLLIAPEPAQCAMVLPRQFWADELKDR